VGCWPVCRPAKKPDLPPNAWANEREPACQRRAGPSSFGGSIAFGTTACLVYWLLLTPLALLSCSSVPRISASGAIAGYAFSGHVDHVVARDYLEGNELPAELDAARGRLVFAAASPSREDLALLSRTYSPDVATLLFVEALGGRADVRELRDRHSVEVEHVRRAGPESARPSPPADLLVLMVPGWFYESHGDETNADFHIQRDLYRRWGIAHKLVPIEENGTVFRNAQIVADAVREASRRHRIFIVSASKSGAEVALALGLALSRDECRAVVGWLSIVGVIQGSPLVDQVVQSPALYPMVRIGFALQGHGMDGMRSMSARLLRRAHQALSVPESIRKFALIAVPLSGQVSERAYSTYERLREFGPNDGLTLLADELMPGTVPLILPGTDHFLGPDDQRAWSTALFRVLLNELPQATGR
jgi:hypothetical protein